ncbi:hypothetical protein IDH28_00940 [Pelagibacterales bacterium SAG-MED31]|nr:hypothetical protein [Pelagibacterales bacterium SAG-MED31]
MGLGDDLMIVSFAEQEKKKHPNKQIVIGNLDLKKIYDSLIYENNPNITPINKIDVKKPIHFINYHKKNRPYIDYKNSNNNKYHWNMAFTPTPGKLYFTKDEKIKAKKILKLANNHWNKNNHFKYKGVIFFESTSTKIDHNYYYNKMKNKDWGESNWQELILRLKHEYLIIQSKHKKSKKYKGVFYSSIDFDFRTACAIINECDLFLGPEGGFGHVAAALNKKAVIYFGGWIHPKVTGYHFHQNIYFNHPNSPCGALGYICNHCEDARKSITVDGVYSKVNLAFK